MKSGHGGGGQKRPNMGGRPLYTVPKRKFWKKFGPKKLEKKDPPGGFRVPISGPSMEYFQKSIGLVFLGLEVIFLSVAAVVNFMGDNPASTSV